MRWRILSACIGAILCSSVFSGADSTAANNSTHDYDILIKNAKVFDGSDRPAFPADVVIRDNAIVKVQTSIDADAATVINGNGLHVCPGFIDLHTHVDSGMYFPEHRACLNYLKQGVTAVVVGQCGARSGQHCD